MTVTVQTTRAPSFLAAVDPVTDARPVAFGVAPRDARPVVRPLAARRAPAAPSAEQLAAIQAAAMAKVAHATEVLRLQAERLAEQARSDALEIGFAVARHILDVELNTSPEALFSLVRGALRRAGDSRRIVVRLHPDDARLVAPSAAAGDLGVAVAAVEVAPDAALGRGDCVVETDYGKVDGRLSTRIEELHRAAAAALDEGEG
jgi:flagellar assembly protein FliH